MVKKKTKFTKFDVAKHLETPEMVAEFLAIAIEEADGDMATITHALNTVARARNMSQLARDAGVTREGLYKALSPDGNPSFATVMKIVQSFGLQVTFKPAP
jgi:probable addiction module antidote protein